MMSGDDRADHVREELGAYVLGGLSPVDQRTVEAHVDGCASCRDELARLSGMPALLDRLTADEVVADLATAPDVIRAGVDEVVARRVTDLQRQVRRWRVTAGVAAGVAVLAAGGLLVPVLGDRDADDDLVDPVVLRLSAADAAAVDTDGVVAAYAWDWGTTVEVEVEGLPDRAEYVIWVVAEDGDRSTAGTWGPTDGGRANVRGASAMARDRMVAIEIRDGRGDLLLAADLEHDHDEAGEAPSAPDDW